MFNRVTDYIKSVNDKYIKELLTNIFVKNTDIANSFKKHTAAKTMHHNYLGGLIEQYSFCYRFV
ncbi:MAG: hypothetical protein ACLUE7_12675 [Lachnospirales bacterium]